jgi:hypothetical protein
MKKITLLGLFLFCQNFYAQSYSSGNIVLSSSNGINYSAVIETDAQNVTLTLIGPSARYLGLGFGVNAMTAGGDVVIFDGNNLTDRTLNGNGTPTLDPVQTWNIISNSVSNNVRTLVARRPLNSGQPNNFVFNNNGQAIMLIWAVASSNSFALSYHGSNRGATMSSFTLSQNTFANESFSMFPNPAENVLTVNLPENISQAQLTIYDLLGKRIQQKTISETNNIIDVSAIAKGTYLVMISSEGFVETQKLIIQ